MRRVEAAREPTEVDLAYAAGFIDGEGCIYVGASSARRSPLHLRVSVSQNVRAPLTYLEEFLGSDAFQVVGSGFELRWFRAQAAVVLQQVRPYLKRKGPEADLAIEYQSIRPARGGRMTDKEVERCWEIYRELRILKGGEKL